jgi:hypothetical protein
MLSSKRGFMVRSEGGRICCDINGLPGWVKTLGAVRSYRCLSSLPQGEPSRARRRARRAAPSIEQTTCPPKAKVTRSNRVGVRLFDAVSRSRRIDANDPKQAPRMSGSQSLAPLIAELRRCIAGDRLAVAEPGSIE